MKKPMDQDLDLSMGYSLLLQDLNIFLDTPIHSLLKLPEFTPDRQSLSRGLSR